MDELLISLLNVRKLLKNNEIPGINEEILDEMIEDLKIKSEQKRII